MSYNATQRWVYVLLITLGFITMGAYSANAQLRTRIVVLPFYVERGNQADTGFSGIGEHYRTMSGFIENHLVSHDFDVIDPFASDAAEREISRVMERAREDSALVSQNMCQRYGVDATYIVWLDITVRRTGDGYFKASAILKGKGYDSARRSIGANLVKTFKISRRDREEAIVVVEKEVGDVVGKVLTNWNKKRIAGYGSSSYSDSGKGESILSKGIDKQAQHLNITLVQATEYELVEAFGKVLNTVRGISNTRRYSQRIVPDNPQACITEWGVEITRQTDPFRLQSNIMKTVNDILDAGGTIRIDGVPYRYSPSEMKLMMGLRPGEATSRYIQFVVDRERARDRDAADRHDPEESNYSGSKPAFD